MHRHSKSTGQHARSSGSAIMSMSELLKGQIDAKNNLEFCGMGLLPIALHNNAEFARAFHHQRGVGRTCQLQDELNSGNCSQNCQNHTWCRSIPNFPRAWCVHSRRVERKRVSRYSPWKITTLQPEHAFFLALGILVSCWSYSTSEEDAAERVMKVEMKIPKGILETALWWKKKFTKQ